MPDVPLAVPQLLQHVRYEPVRERRTGHLELDFAGRVVLLAVAELEDPLADCEDYLQKRPANREKFISHNIPRRKSIFLLLSIDPRRFVGFN